MWNIAVPWWELVLRCVIVYSFLIVLLRVSGKRQIGQLAPFDLVLLLVLSNSVQNSMNAGDNSLVGGLDFRRNPGGTQCGHRVCHLSQQENGSPD